MPEFEEKKEQISDWFTYGTLGVILMLIGTLTVLIATPSKFNILRLDTISQMRNRLIRLDTQTSRYILRSGMPILDRMAEEDDPFTLLHFNWPEIYWKLAANVKNASPQEILRAQIPLLALFKPKPLPIPHPPAIPPPLIKKVTLESPPPAPAPKPLGLPEILIYHTHTSESYLPVSGKDHHLNEKGDIVKVGERLKEILGEKYGIKCLHNEEIHDQYPFRDSYKRSQVTLMKYLKEYPSLKVVLDVHRDATPGIDATCTIKGKDTATIMIVVGSDKMGLPHPNWQKNNHFAGELAENMNLYYPGLNSGVIVSEARYNQHLHDHALIIEFGDQNSDFEEVFQAADLFAEILAQTMHQEFVTGTEKN